MRSGTSAGAPPRAPGRPLVAVLLAGAAAGVLDILAAFVNSGIKGTSPLVVLKAIASGLLGRAAFQGGPAVAALGLFLHFVIATGWAAIYFLASRRLPVLLERPVIFGMLYGAVVTILMHHVVVPLSAAPSFGTPTFRSTVIRFGIHLFFVGLPIGVVISRYAGRERPA